MSLLKESECINFASACRTIGPTRCQGRYNYTCYYQAQTSDPSSGYPADTCARCLCNNSDALLPDLACVQPAASDAASANATNIVSGGGVGVPVVATAIQPSSSATATTSLVPHSGSLSGTDTQNGSGSGTPAWALPVYVSLTVVAIASACVAVYWYMKRKSPLPTSNASSPIPVTSRKPFLQSIWTTTTTTTTTKDPENPDTNQTKTTTVTYSAFPHGLPPIGRPPALNVPVEDQPKAVVNTPFLPTDSFLTPNSGYANSPTTSTWTLEEQWQYEQYQAAAYWHQFQLRQKEWQAEQRAYYLLKEEERKKKQLESGTEIELVPRRKLTVGFKPSPLRNVYEIDDESDVSRKNSKASRTSHRVSSILDGIVGTTIGRSSFDAGTAGRPDFMSTRSSFNKSISSRKSSMIVTSPEWSAPSDLVTIGGFNRSRETARSRMDTLKRSVIEIDTGGLSSSTSAKDTTLTLTSSTFALGEDVSVVTIKSMGEDGTVITSQVLTASIGSGSVHSSEPHQYSQTDQNSVASPSTMEPPSPVDFDPSEIVDDDMQVKYPVLRAHVSLYDDELRLEVGDEVVVWHILDDGNCEGYCIRTKERGFFPVKAVLA